MRTGLRLFAFGAALAGAALTLAACSDGDDVATSKIFRAAPWKDGELSVYRVAERGVDGVGTCTLETKVDFEPAKTRLEHRCDNGPYHDNGNAVVDTKTLVPLSSERIATDDKNQRQTSYTVTYGARTATFTADTGGSTHETTRDLPAPTRVSPDPGWYDDESLLWLARGVPLETGWQGGYSHVINAGQPRVLGVQVRVEQPEPVKVPAGEFSAWKVRFQRSDIVYFVWVDVQAPNRVVKAQIEDVTYELTGLR